MSLVVKQLVKMLKNLLNINPDNYIKIYTTGETEEFRYSSSGFFDYTGLKVEHIVIK